MDSFRKNSLLFILASLWLSLLLILGGWWLYLIVTMGQKLTQLNQNQINFIKLAKWEGSTFLVLLLLISTTTVYLFLRDQKKNRSIHAFFASLTHELKTPLASMRLQTEVAGELCPKAKTPLKRLLEDNVKMEGQLDNILQLSRLELGGNYSPSQIDLLAFFYQLRDKYFPHLEFNCSGTEASIYFDEFALQVIIRNLLENTSRHTTSKKVDLNLQVTKKSLVLTYNDHGPTFQGSVKKLSSLFYKYDSSKGSGIGLYLIKNLLKRNSSTLQFEARPNLIFTLCFPLLKNTAEA